MKKLNLTLLALLLISLMQLSAQDYHMTSPIGYGRNATGGGNASTTTVTSYDELKTALTASGSRIILIKGSIQVDYLSVLVEDKTILGLPGSKLYTNDQSSGKSGILYFKNGTNNVIMRNVTFVGPGAYDSDGRDCLTFDGATNCWVDHCDFQDGMDGNFDNKGNTDNITVSWCKFSYNKPPKSGGSGGSDDHRYTNLVGSSSSDSPSDGQFSITWQYCWWAEGCVERMVRARNADLHMLNCFWNSSVAKKCLGLEDGSNGNGTQCYLEGGVFETPSSTKNIDPSYGGSPDVTVKDCIGSSLNDNSSTVSKPSYSYSALSASKVKSAVTSNCGAGATLNVSTSGVVSSSCDGTNPPPTYTLSTNTSGSGSVSGAGTYDEGTSVTVRASASSGWTFSNWTGDASGTSTSASVNMTSNKSVTAVFVEGDDPVDPVGDITHNFTESGTSSSVFDITGNLSTSKGTVTYAGLTLTQCLKIESSTSISFTTSQEGTLTLVFNDDFSDGIKIDGTSQDVSSGTLTTTLSAGNHEITKDNSANLYYISITNNGTDPVVTYSLSTIINGSGSVNPSSGTYEAGTSVSMTATPASGWQFDSWSGGSTSNPATVVMNANKSITANFSLKPDDCNPSAITSYISVNGGSWNQTNSATLVEGGSVGFGPQPSQGGSWSWSGPNGFSSSSRDVELTNVLASQSGTYSVSHINDCGASSSSSISLSVQPVDGSITAIIQEDAAGFCNVDGSIDNNNSGFTGNGFANTDNSTGNGIDYKINSSGGTATLKIQYASSSDRPAKIIVNNNTVVSNLSMPSTGSWTSWTSVSTSISLASGVNELRIEATGSSGLANVDYISVTGSGVSAADCDGETPVTYTLSTTIYGQGSVNPSSGTYAEGTSVSMTATPASGWQFDSWSGGSTSNPATVVMDANKSITANFSEVVSGAISLSASAGDSQVSLSWSSSNISSSFEVYRDLDSELAGRVRIATTASSSYTDSDVSNGTTYYYSIKATDVNSAAVNSNVANATPQGSSQDIEITLQENESGFCNVDGSVDNNNSGFTGDGFANTVNAAGNGVDWNISFASTGTYTFVFRYASSSDRPANLMINGSTVVSNISFPSTGSWTTWSTVSFTATVSAGINDVRLEATGSSGLANIDYILISGNNPQAIDCSQLKNAEGPLSMTETENLNTMEVFPNPFSTSATIRFTLNSTQQISFKIYDLTGRIVDEIAETSYDSGENSIVYYNSGLKSGIYMLSIQNGAIINNKRLVIE